MEKSVLLLSVLVLVCSWTPQGLSAEEDQIPDFCNLPKLPDEGPVCMAYIPQYFFNATSQKCEEFIYGGCGGNQNRFDSKRKCMETCHPKIVTLLVLDTTAEASGYDRRRGYDRSSHHGSKKVCGLPSESGPCLAYKPRFFYNDTSEQCEIFIYGGCRGNHNNFKSLSSCRAYCHDYPTLNATEVCKMPPETGPCKAYFPQIYYNPESQRCEPFVYGGCGGNKNRFDSVRECLHLCHPGGSDVIIPLIAPHKSELNPTAICHLPPKTGPCRAHIPRYYFNSMTRRCEKFIYGGCNGNPNNFVSERACLLQCYPRGNDTITPLPEEPGAKRTAICHLPPKKGPCPAHIPRYYFNPKEKKCEEFIYGGCDGNQNNFVDLQHCVKKCALL